MFKQYYITVNGNKDEILEKLIDKGYKVNFKLTDNPVVITTNPCGGIALWNFPPSGCYMKDIEFKL